MNNAGQTTAGGDTVERKPEAGLRPANLPPGKAETNLTTRLQELADLREKCRTGKTGPTVDQILDELRADRV